MHTNFTTLLKQYYFVGIAIAKPCQAMLSDYMSKYQEFLKCKYDNLEPISIDKTLDCSSSQYIDLTLKKLERGNVKSAEKRKGDIITLSEALNVESEKKKVILIKGDPGMGKTTLAINICKSWAEGKLLQSYNAVILLLLRNPEVQRAETIEDLLMTPNTELRENIYREITDSYGKNICFILEGYDELPEQKQLVFSKLKDLPKCTIVYTSRPESCHGIECSRIIEITGFTESSIRNYIESTFEDDEDRAKLLSQLLASHFCGMTGLDILRIPIIVAIVCLIFYYDKKIPETLTKLYNLFCIRLILRYTNTRASTESGMTILRSLDLLPSNISEQFSQLCCFACKSIEKNKFIFTSQDLDDVGIAESQIGLLVTAPNFSKFGVEKSYNFMHKTVQEFCAAWHISKAFSPEDQLSYISSHWHDINYRMVWLFYSGITGLNNREVLDCMLPYKQMSSSLTNRTMRHLIDCVFEAQSDLVCQTVMDYLAGDVIDLSHSWVANRYFLMRCKGKLRTINADNYNDIVFEKLIQLLEKGYLGHNEGLVLTFSISKISFSLLLRLADLRYPIIELSINVMQSECVEYTDGVQTVPLCNDFLLKLFSITPKVGNIRLTMEGSHCSDLTNSHLNFLNMHHCLLNPTAISKIGSILQDVSSLTVIDLSCNSINDLDVENIANYFNKIQQLSLCNNNITADGVHYLSKMMKTLTSLDLSQNPLKDKGVYVILSSFVTSVSHIGLLSVEMTSSSYHIIADALHKVNSICFDLPTADCKVICDSLINTTVLSYIQVKIEDLTTNCCLLSAVSQNVHIKGLTVYYGVRNIKVANGINTWLEGVFSLLEHTKTLTELTIINFDDGCSLLDDILMLADFFKQNKSIELFNYDDNLMYTDTALNFVELLTDAYTLQHVILRVCVDPTCNCNQYLAAMEKSVKRINKFRRQKGVTSLLHVTIDIDDSFLM